jgi:hypothetical protein
MKFPYKKYSAQVIRPVIPIQVRYGENTAKYEVLVDSGADMCLFDAEMGELLGIDVEQGRAHTVTGVTANPQKYYMHPVTISVGGWEYKIQAGFMPHFTSEYGIVGQIGFFEQFTVKFTYRKGEVEIKPLEEKN